ncbi:MAG: helix-turn-helix transcriptional regulator [Bacteroidota bacterium]
MKGTYLGEFQEIVLLTVIVLNDNAYGVLIQKEISKHSGRSISRGALHSALSRLEEKGYLSGKLGEASKKRGGKRKKYYHLTPLGQRALDEAEAIRKSFQMAIQAVQS